MVPKKPLIKEDIIPKFKNIGDPGWADYALALLKTYEVPLPIPSTEKDFEKIEIYSNYKLPEEFILFHKEIGPLFELLEIHEINPGHKSGYNIVFMSR